MPWPNIEYQKRLQLLKKRNSRAEKYSNGNEKNHYRDSTADLTK